MPRPKKIFTKEQLRAANVLWSRAYRKRHPQRLKLLNKLRNQKPEAKQQSRGYTLLRKYGITLETYKRQIEIQSGRCIICNIKPDNLHVDHCHKCGNVRALLCGHCNTMLGYARDTPSILRSAADYLDTLSCQKD